MDTKIAILFYGKKYKTTKENLLPIYMRVTINGKRYEVSTQRYIESTKWSTAGKVKGNSEEARTINNYLDILKGKVYQYQKELIHENINLTVQTFKAKWLGMHESPRMLLQVFKEHNDQLKALVGQEYSPATLERYHTS